MPASVPCCMLSELNNEKVTEGEGGSNLSNVSTKCGVVLDGIYAFGRCYMMMMSSLLSVLPSFYLELFIETSMTTQESRTIGHILIDVSSISIMSFESRLGLSGLGIVSSFSTSCLYLCLVFVFVFSLCLCL